MKKINLKLEKNITFYCEDIPERQLISPLYEIFKENKYKVESPIILVKIQKLVTTALLLLM